MEDDMAILESVKLAARIKGNTLDPEIERLITWARSEMERAGIPSQFAAAEDDPLINECAIQGVLMHIATDAKIREAAEKSFTYQLDNLRKRSKWPGEDDPDDGGDLCAP